MKIEATHWWEDDTYTVTDAVPDQLLDFAGPKGIAFVTVFERDDKVYTTRGWGVSDPKKPGFTLKYSKGFFAREQHVQPDKPFAIVMRSLRLVCIDIDGKNKGDISARRILGNTPRTLAERSKSGTGWHLFYYIEDTWNPRLGYASVPDKINFEPGIDLRGTGCVYHYPQQRWNDAEIAQLPPHLLERFLAIAEVRAEQKQLAVYATEEERLLAAAEYLSRLQRPVREGSRNNTLFAVGCALKGINLHDWQKHIFTAGLDWGLDTQELNHLIRSVERTG